MNSEKFSTEKDQQKFCIPPEAWAELETDDTIPDSEDISIMQTPDQDVEKNISNLGNNKNDLQKIPSIMNEDRESAGCDESKLLISPNKFELANCEESNTSECSVSPDLPGNTGIDGGKDAGILSSGQFEPKCKYKKVRTDSLRPFEPHPFKVLDNDEMQRLIEDIRTHGVLDEIIVRPIISSEGEYEIICGHRRKYACDKLGIKHIPAKICRLDDHEAASLMLYSNLSQRKSLLPSEKAKAYKLEFELQKHQGKKGQGHTSDIIGRKTGDSPSTVKRMRKIAELPDKFLNLIDQKKLGLWQAYILASAELDKPCSNLIYDVIINNKSAMTKVQAEQIKNAYLNYNLTTEAVNEIMSAKERNKSQEIRLDAERIYEYLPRSYSIRQIEDAICLALEVWNDQTKDV